MSRSALRSAGPLGGALGLLVGAAALAPAAWAVPGPSSACVTADDQQHVTCTYGYTGAPQTLVIPQGVETVDVVAVGGVGGNGATSTTLAQPARVDGALDVDPGQTLFVMVGGNGGDATTATDGASAPGGAPGWNGGAWGGGAIAGPGATTDSGAGGGGASDIRTVAEDQAGTLDSRLLVAAGSGGGAHVREGGWGDLNGWTYDGYGANAAAMGTTTAGGATGTLWSWFGSHGEYGVGGTGRGMPAGAGAGAGGGGGGGGGGVYGGGGGAIESSGAGGGSLAPAGGTTGWSTDHSGSIVISYVLPAQAEPETSTPPTPTGPVADGPVAAKVSAATIVQGSQQT
ncbi:glycine-rich protein, partial [Modestobacter roseus]